MPNNRGWACRGAAQRVLALWEAHSRAARGRRSRVPICRASLFRLERAQASASACWKAPEARASPNPAPPWLRYVLEDAGGDALVLVDELGKGTEARAGTALAAALLEHLARTGARGIFATCAPWAPRHTPASSVESDMAFLTGVCPTVRAVLLQHRAPPTMCPHLKHTPFCVVCFGRALVRMVCDVKWS